MSWTAPALCLWTWLGRTRGQRYHLYPDPGDPTPCGSGGLFLSTYPLNYTIHQHLHQPKMRKQIGKLSTNNILKGHRRGCWIAAVVIAIVVSCFNAISNVYKQILSQCRLPSFVGRISDKITPPPHEYENKYVLYWLQILQYILQQHQDIATASRYCN